MPPPDHICPDCDEPLAFAFQETSGLSAWTRGEGNNLTPDTHHYVCFPCRKSWKQRLDGPLTGDVVGDLVFFTCGKAGCGLPLEITRESLVPTEVELACRSGHRFAVRMGDEDALRLSEF